ncbi:hypothetical protein DFH94DRAFT_739517 [Russula ochroleuca]|jgi:hypothetical protein|uniref:Uncharacterized protein n=1 Tax=Russula ochroleuca TaxID=152965 RepID=A0A9P5MXS0_9AGAM|nr:hypothetical protein DFH94DRAFT_739517 [Russula ochroleuca]
MLWGISSFAALFLDSAARALPQRDLGDLLPVGPEIDPGAEVGEPVPVTIQTSHSSHTEQASTLSPIENATSALLQPTTHTAQLTIVVTGVSSHPRLTATQTPTTRLPTPVPEGNNTHTSIIATSASQNTANPTWYPSPLPVDSEQGQGHAVDWRVIGIAVIAVSVVGAMILLVIFFDQWWGFLCDVCGRRRKWRGGGREELVPDWERGSWVFKVEDDKLPAYPSFSSPPAKQMQEGIAARTQPWKADMIYRPDLKMSPDYLVFPPSWTRKDNGQVFGTQGVPCGPSRQHVVQFPPSDVVDEGTAYKLHSPLCRSNTQKSTTSQDAYDGLAA